MCGCTKIELRSVFFSFSANQQPRAELNADRDSNQWSHDWCYGAVFFGIAVFADCCTDSNSTLSGLKTEDYQEVG